MIAEPDSTRRVSHLEPRGLLSNAHYQGYLLMYLCSCSFNHHRSSLFNLGPTPQNVTVRTTIGKLMYFSSPYLKCQLNERGKEGHPATAR